MIFIHIGRGKVGSSTIQRALEGNADRLRTAGFAWPEATEGTRYNFVALAHQLFQRERNGAAIEQLRAVARRATGDVVISSEFLFPMREERLRRLKQVVGDDVTILVYVRDYAAWVRSSYLQGIRQGVRYQNFDEYYRSGFATVSVRPALERWADAFGPGAFRVRHLEALEPDDLISDFGKAIGAELTPPPDKNRSPHWLAIEFLRAMLECEPESGGLRSRWPAARAVVADFRKAIKPLDLPDVQYCSAGQLAELNALYAEDCEWLESMFGMEPPGMAPVTSERPFLPTLSAGPSALGDIVASLRVEQAQSHLYLAEVLDEVARRYL